MPRTPRRSWGWAALALAFMPSACDRKRVASNEWGSNQGALQAPAPVPEPMPVEAPLEKLRVPNSGLPCAVDDVLANKCRRCHNTPARHNAPFPLFTWEDTRQLFHEERPRYVVMASAVKSGFMPYNTVANPPVERLTEEEKQVIVSWVEAGAPRVDCGAAAVGSGSGKAKAGKAPAIPKRHQPRFDSTAPLR